MPETDKHDPKIDSLVQQAGAGAGRNFDSPPLDDWHPPLSGDIDIVIKADGRWWHEGALFERSSIVALFASILRREPDGEYYLVTPAEKWRIQVEAHPLLVTSFDPLPGASQQTLSATLNTGKSYPLDAEHPLFLDPAREGVAGMALPHGLTALCTRAAWYRLVEQAKDVEGVPTIRSGGRDWPLQ